MNEAPPEARGYGLILVVEDESLVAEEIRERLTGLGFRVLAVVETGEAAIEAVGEARPDLVLMDIRLKGKMDGIDAGQKISQAFDIPVVFLTAHSDQATLKRARDVAPFGYVLKPFHERDLLVAVEMGMARHRAESRLRQSERRYATTLQGIHDAVLATDQEGRVTFLNPVAEMLTRWTLDEARGRRVEEVFQVVDERTQQLLPGPIDQVLASGRPQRLPPDTALVTRLGEAVPIDDSVAPIRDERGTCVGTVLVFRDLRGKRHAEASLRQSEARFKAFMDHCPARAFIKDAQGRYLYANRPWEEQFSPPRADWLGKTDHNFWPEETAALFRESDEAALASGRLVERLDRGRGHTGEPRCWLTYKFPLTSVLGEPTVGGFTLDVSDRQELEERLRQAEKMEVIGRLAGGVAHDFNNLLTIINGYAFLMAERLPADSPWREPAEQVLAASERAADLTRQLLAFGRQQRLQPRVLDLNEAIRGYEKFLRRLIPENIRILTLLHPALHRILIDPTQLEQVLLNLAVNARDAMSDGGKLIIQTFNRDIGADSPPGPAGVPPGSYVQLHVGDTGCGMDEATRQRIFEPFFTTKELGKGTGLGLATVYGVVKQSGGWISVASEVGRGTTFTLLFPATSGPLAAGPTEECSPRARKASETILLVEDEDHLRRLVAAVLREQGYTVLEASHGMQALEARAAYPQPVHLLITDLVMPHLGGSALAGLLAQKQPELRVLFISGYDHAPPSAPPAASLRSAFLQKPFRPAALLEAVQDLLDRP